MMKLQAMTRLADIANLAFIGGKTNRAISDERPVDYFPGLISNVGTGPFEAQCIPTDRDLLSADQYKVFLNARRETIAVRLNEFLGFQDGAGGDLK